MIMRVPGLVGEPFDLLMRRLRQQIIIVAGPSLIRVWQNEATGESICWRPVWQQPCMSGDKPANGGSVNHRPTQVQQRILQKTKCGQIQNLSPFKVQQCSHPEDKRWICSSDRCVGTVQSHRYGWWNNLPGNLAARMISVAEWRWH